ncbi:SAM-dependent methyltransferase [Georgenia sp. EYE_87]|uniref:methyltransferase domain-containing protein n=1 Tax=Georgenia sp. EYE_87 TaxID=2853448 RepID=UPI0020066D67|nr:methyltransferase domain-containing protein [Georgenia sp. EYE_87]MCK6211421.1 SAM-dependent methyltransferase [Georgenia sp. EYE_87]
MTGCCDPRGYEATFTPRFARRLARRYRRRGLDRLTAKVVRRCVDHGIEGATVLEIGGGVGELHLELLRRGAATATNLELVGTYERDAAELLAEAGMTGRVRRRLLDLAADPAAVEPADVVVLNRVVCCYPDLSGLLGAAAGRARRLLVLTYPRSNPFTRGLMAVENGVTALLGRPYRAFVRPPAEILAVLRAHGLEPAGSENGAIWCLTAATPVSAAAPRPA